MQARHLTGLVVGTVLFFGYGCGGSSPIHGADSSFAAVPIGPAPSNMQIYGVSPANRSGNVVGFMQAVNGGYQPVPYIWSQRKGLQALPLPSGITLGVASAINDDGTIVGYGASAAGQYSGIAWDSNEVPQVIGNLGGGYSTLDTISNNGVAGGLSTDPSGKLRPITWTATAGIKDLVSLLGFTATIYGINDSGTIVGTAPNNGIQQAFAYTTSGGFQWLAMFSGTASSATGVSENNLVTGFTMINNDSRTFTWSPVSGGQLLAEAPPTASNHRGYSRINSSGAVVGGGEDAYIWTQASGYKMLTPRTTGLPSGVHLYSGISINEESEIVAWAGGHDYYLLTLKH